MLWYDYLIHYISTLIGLFIMVEMYNYLFDRKKLTIKDVCIVLGISLLSTANTLTNYTFSKILIFYLLYVSALWLIFKDHIKKIIVSGMIIYLIVLILELVCSIIILILSIANVKELNDLPLYKLLVSSIVMLLALLLIHIKKVKSFIFKVVNIIIPKDTPILLGILTLTILILSSITFRNALNFESITYYFINIVIIILMLSILSILIYNIILRKKAENKENALLKFIKKYEYLIDKDRINRHEMLNNLLVIKSFKDRNTKEFDNLIDSLIKSYKSTGSKIASNLYNLPSGLKGIIYYKIYDMEKEKIKVETNISNIAINKLDKLDAKTYTKVCKIIGILTDNAIDAAKVVKKKKITIEMFKEKNRICIKISNTAEIKNINIEKINEKAYSSKGENRGYGLFLAKKMIMSSKRLKLKQEIIENMFISTLFIEC